MKRYTWLRTIQQLDPERDFLEIYRITATYEFPWDIYQVLQLSTYRTFAVPSIGGLLGETRELLDHTQKRHDDTGLLLDSITEYGLDDRRGRTAIRRVNQMHRSYSISNDDMRYVLCVFVVMPKRWLDTYGWRRLCEQEIRAIVNYYSEVGRRMGITEIPREFAEFERFMDDYEDANFGFDEGARRTSDATLKLLSGWYPRPLGPLVRAASLALLDDGPLRALRYPLPNPVLRKVVRKAVRLRARVVRLMPPRRNPCYLRESSRFKSYPHGYNIAGLGTFPAAVDLIPSADSDC